MSKEGNPVGCGKSDLPVYNKLVFSRISFLIAKTGLAYLKRDAHKLDTDFSLLDYTDCHLFALR
jgi:hypothetical protein